LRLSLLALVESWVRAGASDWQCGKYLGQSSERLLRECVCRNLVWRVGRVEATARKVALAVAHALLRAGAAPPEALYKIAPDLVPLLSSSLDENDTTVRHMSCLCLRVVFERLRGAFGPQAVGELYPLIIKRLDDSSDQIRVEACFVLASFMAAVQAGAFSGTPLDYVLDVLFVHLDDPNPAVQDAVLRVVMQAALLDRALVKRKTEANRTALRSPDVVERLLAL
jgi:dynein assembly factor 5